MTVQRYVAGTLPVRKSKLDQYFLNNRVSNIETIINNQNINAEPSADNFEELQIILENQKI